MRRPPESAPKQPVANLPLLRTGLEKETLSAAAGINGRVHCLQQAAAKLYEISMIAETQTVMNNLAHGNSI